MKSEPPRSQDNLLRSKGYEVTDRPRDGEAKWRLGHRGKPVTQTAALAEIARRSK